MLEERDRTFVLVVLCLSHAEKFEIFWSWDCQIAAPITVFQELFLPEIKAFEWVTIISDYC